MRAESILRRVLADVETEIHQSRLNAVCAAVLALIAGGEVGLAALGRAIAVRSHKHGIKRVDRLLGNQRLADELDMVYGAIVRYVLRSIKRPVILLDWTKAGDTMCSLTAAVPVQGRAITIYSVTVPSVKYTAPEVEKAFLATLKTLLGEECAPILVGDAGFRATWMQRVRAIGWDFVTRIRGRTHVQRVDEEQWQHWKKLIPEVRRVPRALGTYRFVRTRGVEAQLVVVGQRRARSAKTVQRPKTVRTQSARRSHCEPWFLATSLTLPAKQVVALYAARMQIELTFRDLKSHRFGWGFEDARSRFTRRVAIQIMLAALASLVCMLIGLAAEACNIHRQYQANTITTRRVLSLVTLGRAVLRTACLRRRLRIPVISRRVLFVGIP